MKSCFFTYYSPSYTALKDGLVKSVKKFYPDIPHIEHQIGEGQSALYNDDVYDFIINLHDIYERVIFINADSVMCAPSPHLFDDFEYGMPRNNNESWSHPEKKGGNLYMNNGLQVTTNKQIWIDQKAIKSKIGKQDQDNCSSIFWFKGYKNQVFEYPNEIYGIQEYKQYENAQLRSDGIYIGEKKVCVFHFATGWHKDYKIALERFINKEVAEKIKELIT